MQVSGQLFSLTLHIELSAPLKKSSETQALVYKRRHKITQKAIL